MKKRKKTKELQDIALKNPVAKFAGQFNRAQTFKDKTKYQRKAKHQGKEPFPIILLMLLEKAPTLYKLIESTHSSLLFCHVSPRLIHTT